VAAVTDKSSRNRPFVPIKSTIRILRMRGIRLQNMPDRKLPFDCDSSAPGFGRPHLSITPLLRQRLTAIPASVRLRPRPIVNRAGPVFAFGQSQTLTKCCMSALFC
jgi:hypothetical protein